MIAKVPTPCREWQGATDRDGYGRKRDRDLKKQVRIHRPTGQAPLPNLPPRTLTQLPQRKGSIMNTNLPTRQREALFLANHGPLAMVKGFKPQAKALVAKGLLDSELQPTEAGRQMYAELTRTRTWAEVLDTFGSWRFSRSGRSTSPVRYSVAGMITVLSADRRTAYLTEHGVTSPTVAIDVEDIPDPYLKFFGLAREPFFHTVVPA